MGLQLAEATKWEAAGYDRASEEYLSRLQLLSQALEVGRHMVDWLLSVEMCPLCLKAHGRVRASLYLIYGTCF